MHRFMIETCYWRLMDYGRSPAFVSPGPFQVWFLQLRWCLSSFHMEFVAFGGGIRIVPYTPAFVQMCLEFGNISCE